MTAPSHLIGMHLAYTTPQHVTHWGARIALTVAVLAVIALAVWGMRRGWQNKAKRQADLPVPASAPTAESPTLCDPISGTFLATTISGDWLNRIVVHSLGVPSKVVATVHQDGLLLEREGEPNIFIERAELSAVRLDRGLAGEVYEAGSVVIVTWTIGEASLDTGIRPAHTSDTITLATALATLIDSPAEPPAQPESEGAS